MADPLSVASAIAGLVTLVDLVFIKAFRYVREVQSAEKNVKDLVRLLQTMCGTLHVLRQRFSVLDEDGDHPDLGLLPPILEDCSQLLADVDMRLAKYQKHNLSTPQTRTDKLSNTLKKLQWPFDVSSTNQLLDQLTKFNNVLNTVLSANTMLAVHETLKAAGELREDINKLENSLNEKLHQVLSAELNKQQREAVEHFQVSDPTERHRTAIKLWQRGTGQWFTESEEYTSWLDGKTPKLWLSGIPGAGKTILASAIIEKTRKECLKGDENKALAYFYCDYKDPQTHEPSNVVSSIAAQIAVYSNDAMKVLVRHHQKFCQPGRPLCLEEQPETIDIIREMTHNFDRILILVDGLDECGTNAPNVIAELDRLVLTNPIKLSILLLSRHEHEIEYLLAKDYSHFQIAARSPDLRLYVYAQIEKRTADGRMIIDDANIKSRIIETLVNRADGMFRWVACQIDFLCDLATDSEREAALSDLPPDLYSSYDRILDRVNRKGPSIQKLVQRALKWIIVSCDRLTVVALREALAVEQGHTALIKENMPSESTILRHCSSFVRKSVNGLYIEPAHFTVKEYLEKITESNEHYRKYCIDHGVTDLYLARTCLTYLNLRDFGNFERLQEHVERAVRHPFRQHAVENWHFYAQKHMDDSIVATLAQHLLSPDRNTNFLTWLHDYIWSRLRWTTDENISNECTKFSENVTPLHCAAFLHIPELVEWLINKGVEINSLSAIGSPLHCTILDSLMIQHNTNSWVEPAKGFVDINRYSTMEVLLRNNADTNQTYYLTSEGRDVSPLHLLLTVHKSDTENLCSYIKLFLDAGATLDAYTGRSFCFSLLQPIDISVMRCFGIDNIEVSYLAEYLDHFRNLQSSAQTKDIESTFSIIGVNSNDQNLQLVHSNLRFAAQFQQLTRLKELLTLRDVDINAADPTSGETALHLAAKRGNADTVRVLLLHGANMEVFDSIGQTPLHKSANRSDPTVASLLISKGARTDIIDEYGDSVWSCAAEAGSVAVLKLIENVFLGQEDKICKAMASKKGPMFQAAKCDDCEEALLFLASNSQRINLVDEDGCNLSHYVSGMSFETFQTLQQRGLNVRVVDKAGRTALHAIAEASLPLEVSIRSIRLLLKEGCEPALKSSSGVTALESLLSNESFLSETDLKTSIALVELFCANSMHTAEVRGGKTVLETCTIEAWHQPHFDEIFQQMILWGFQTSPPRNLFADMINQLIRDPDPKWPIGKVFYRRASAILRKLLSTHPDPVVVARSLSGSLAAIWAAKHSMSDLLLDLINAGVSVTCKVNEFKNKNVLQYMMKTCHDEVVLKTILNQISFEELHSEDDTSQSLLHLFCAQDSGMSRNIIDLLLGRGLKLESLNASGETPLMIAARTGSLEQVICLLVHGADICRRDYGGWNAFHHACINDQLEIVERLIAHSGASLPWHVRAGMTLNFRSKPKWTLDDCTVLHLRPIRVSIVKLLLDNQPRLNINATTATLETPLHIAAVIGTTEVIHVLIDRGANIESQNNKCRTPFHLASLHDRLDILQALSSRGADVAARDKDEMTALHYAAKNGNTGMVRVLLDLGISSSRDALGLTPEMLARSSGHLLIAETLRSHFEQHPDKGEADLSNTVESPMGLKVFSALLEAIRSGDSDLVSDLSTLDTVKKTPACSGCSPVHVGAECGKWDIVAALIENNYPVYSIACQHCATPGVSPLHLALRLETPKQVLELLLTHINKNDIFARFPINPVHIAAAFGNTEAMKTLLHQYSIGISNVRFIHDMLFIDEERLKGPISDIYPAQDSSFMAGTALHVAAAENQPAIVKMLLDCGVSTESRTPGDLLTPLHFAARSGSIEILAILLDCGANVEARSSEGYTPLFFAMQYEMTTSVEYLYKRGASIQIDELQLVCHKSLMRAPCNSSWLLNESLPTKSLAATLVSSNGFWDGGSAHVLFWANDALPDNFELPMDSLTRHIYNAGMSRFPQVLRWLKKKELLSIQIQCKHFSPLCVATQKGIPTMINMLLDAGADINYDGCLHGSALNLACAIDRLEIVKTLVRRGASLTMATSDGRIKSAVEKAERFKHITQWLLVDRWTEQKRICNTRYDVSSPEPDTRFWSGLQEVSAPLELCYKQRRDETLLSWHIRKREMLRWFEGKVLHYGSAHKYIFANLD